MPDIGAIAQANADLRYGTQQEAIKRRIAAVEATRAANEAALNQYGTTGRNVIGQTYDVLDKNLAQNRADTGAQLNTAYNQVGQGYRDAQAVLDAQRNEGRQYADAHGQDWADAYAKAQTGIEGVIAKLIGMNADNDATVTGNLKNWGNQMDSILGRGQDIGKQQRADAASRFESDLLNSLAENRLNAQRDTTGLQGNLFDILGERGNFLVSEGDRLAQEAWQRAIQEAELNQRAQQANAELAMRAASMRQSASDRSSDDKWKALEFALRQQAADRGALESDRDYQLRLSELNKSSTNNDDKFKALSILSDPAAVLGPEQRDALEQLAGLPNSRVGAASAGGRTIGGNFAGIFNSQQSSGSGSSLFSSSGLNRLASAGANLPQPQLGGASPALLGRLLKKYSPVKFGTAGKRVG